MIDDLQIWKDEFRKIPTDPVGAIGHKRLSEFVNERVTKKLAFLPGKIKFTPDATFTWQYSIFDAEILALGSVPSNSKIAPRAKVATAWSTATQASTFVIKSGAKMKPKPPGTNGVVAAAVAVLDPDSLSKATSQLTKDLQAGQDAPTPDDSIFSDAMRKAFLSLTYTISGTDTTSSGSGGPIAFLLPKTKVI